jgi:hypothetical protein
VPPTARQSRETTDYIASVNSFLFFKGPQGSREIRVCPLTLGARSLQALRLLLESEPRLAPSADRQRLLFLLALYARFSQNEISSLPVSK